MRTAKPDRCAACAHFDDQPQRLEASLPGLASFSSAYAAVRDADGLCGVHDRYVSARSHCARFSARRQAA